MRIKKIYQLTPIRCCICDKEKDGMFYHFDKNNYGCTKCLKNEHQAESYKSILERINK